MLACTGYVAAKAGLVFQASDLSPACWRHTLTPLSPVRLFDWA